MNTPRFGSLTNPSKDIIKEISRVHKQGFDFVEIGIEPPQGTAEILLRKKAGIRKLLKKFNGKPVGHTSWWVDFGSQHEFVRKGWVSEAKLIIDTAKAIDMDILNFHATSYGMMLGGGRKRTMDRFVSSMREVVRYGKKKGVRIMLENVPDSKLGRFENFNYIIKRTVGLGVHFDAGHAFITGGMKDVERYIHTYRGRIWHVHMHDNHGKEDEHLPLGEGRLNYRKVVKELKKIKYNKTITLEVFPKDQKKLISSRGKVRKLWTT